jgi:hypothetical protein
LSFKADCFEYSRRHLGSRFGPCGSDSRGDLRRIDSDAKHATAADRPQRLPIDPWYNSALNPALRATRPAGRQLSAHTLGVYKNDSENFGFELLSDIGPVINQVRRQRYGLVVSGGPEVAGSGYRGNS